MRSLGGGSVTGQEGRGAQICGPDYARCAAALNAGAWDPQRFLGRELLTVMKIQTAATTASVTRTAKPLVPEIAPIMITWMAARLLFQLCYQCRLIARARVCALEVSRLGRAHRGSRPVQAMKLSLSLDEAGGVTASPNTRGLRIWSSGIGSKMTLAKSIASVGISTSRPALRAKSQAWMKRSNAGKLKPSATERRPPGESTIERQVNVRNGPTSGSYERTPPGARISLDSGTWRIGGRPLWLSPG